MIRMNFAIVLRMEARNLMLMKETLASNVCIKGALIWALVLVSTVMIHYLLIFRFNSLAIQISLDRISAKS